MPDGLEFAQRRAADAMARRIGRGEFGKFFFEIEQFVIKPVVFPVGDCRRGLDVIGMVVRANFLDKLGMAFFGF